MMNNTNKEVSLSLLNEADVNLIVEAFKSIAWNKPISYGSSVIVNDDLVIYLCNSLNLH